MRRAGRSGLVRTGNFGTVAAAARAVQGLLDAGFEKEHVSVVCSDRAKKAYLSEFEHDRPAGSTTTFAATAGAVVGGLAAGLLAISGLVALEGEGLLVVALLFAGMGAALGTFVGAMMSRGVEHEVANFYDQSMTDGEILVAAEIERGGSLVMLDRAERAFEDAGARPITLSQG